MGFGKAQLPRQSRVVNGGKRCSPCSSVIAGNQNDLCASFGDSCCNRPDAGLRNQLDRDTRLFICILQIIDQLRQILDGIDIVMRRRRDQADTRGGVSGLCDPRIHLSARQVAALSGLGSLRHLDLDLLRADQVPAGHAKPSACHLFDRRAAVMVRTCGEDPFITLPALSAV